MAEKDKGTEDFEIVDALKEGTDGGPVEITESGLTLNLGMGGEDEYNEAAPQEVSAAELRALAEVEEELNERWPETKIEPSLDRIELLMDLLGHPERSFDVIHIAGTNGKSSTARMVDSLLRAFHRRVGLVTSHTCSALLSASASMASPFTRAIMCVFGTRSSRLWKWSMPNRTCLCLSSRSLSACPMPRLPTPP